MAIKNVTQTKAMADAGQQSYIRQVFNYMTGGVALTGLVSWFIVSFNGGQLAVQLLNSGLTTPLLLVELGLVMFLGFRIHKLQPATALSLFILYSALNGIVFAPLALVYTQASIATAFFTAAGMFGGMAFWGYTTKKDLGPIGTFLFMGLIGIVVASLINMFIGNSQMEFIISLIGVPLFAGLTAYDMQKIKNIYHTVAYDETARSRAAIMGALNLYLDFINLFLMLLRLMGDRR